MNVIPLCIFCSDYVQQLKHIKEKSISITPSAVIGLMTMNKVLDFGESLFDRIKIGRIGRQVFHMHS